MAYINEPVYELVVDLLTAWESSWFLLNEKGEICGSEI